MGGAGLGRFGSRAKGGMVELTLNGGCLCGGVRYEVSGEARRFYHCHCRRCRKATGTGHATNLFVAPTSVRWWGEELVANYKVPDAERFATRFCSRCGSPLPRMIDAFGVLLIPAGSLDSKLSITPQARIFWDSRAEWSCAEQAIPCFPEYEPRK